MDNQDKLRQKKEKEREERNREQLAHEDESQKKRLPMNPIAMVVGIALVLLVLYIWMFGIW